MNWKFRFAKGLEVVATSGVCARRSYDDGEFQQRNAFVSNGNQVREGTNAQRCTPKARVADNTFVAVYREDCEGAARDGRDRFFQDQ